MNELINIKTYYCTLSLGGWRFWRFCENTWGYSFPTMHKSPANFRKEHYAYSYPDKIRFGFFAFLLHKKNKNYCFDELPSFSWLFPILFKTQKALYSKWHYHSHYYIALLSVMYNIRPFINVNEPRTFFFKFFSL
jgi:hypothetical protein